MEFVFDGGEGAEEQVGGVGHDGGTARGDLVTSLEFVEFAEGAVDGDGGAEFLGFTDELGGDVGLVEVFPAEGGVTGAQAGVRIGDGHAATAAAGGMVLTVELNGFNGNDGAGGYWIHESSFPAEPWSFILGIV